MTIRYCGIGGNDGNSGLTWALRKLTLNGVEDTPVVANDLVYVGPGVYREMLTVDVSGAGGNIITYCADVTGEHTDGVGGIVRVTGSDNDQAAARGNCITANGKDYRTFRGFFFDTTTSHMIDGIDCENWIIEDCSFQNCGGGNGFVACSGVDQTDWIIRRCIFFISRSQGIRFTHGATVDNTNHLVENCFFAVINYDAVNIARIGNVTVRNCLFFAPGGSGVDVETSAAGGQTCTVENCILTGCGNALEGMAVGDITEDYNTFWSNDTDRVLTNVGANSLTYPPLLLPPILHSGVSQISGFKFPWWFGELSEWSQVRAITGSNEPTEDQRGIARPVTASKNSWGALQFADMERETGTVRTGSASLVLHDAGRHQIWVPVTATSTTISVYVYREANYAGNLPQMICKQPGQADDVTTDAAAASQWNLLTTTFTPAADPPYVVVELISRNTAVALAYETFFDDLVVN